MKFQADFHPKANKTPKKINKSIEGEVLHRFTGEIQW